MPFFDLNNSNTGQQNGSDNQQNQINNSQPTNAGQQQNTPPVNNVTEQSGPAFSAQPQPNNAQVPSSFSNEVHSVLNGNTTQPATPQADATPDLDLMFGSPSANPTFHSHAQPDMASHTMSPVTGLQHKLSPNSTDVHAYLELTEQKNASDLHFTVGYPPVLRVDDELQNIGTDPLTADRAAQLFQSITTKEQFDKYEKERELDFSFTSKSGNRFRVNYYWDRGYMAAAFRLIPGRIKTVEELGLPTILYEFAKYPHGLILLTGPTGSGKSTTIAAMLNEINMNQARHIITVEDPIEYIYPRGKALINQREIEKDTLSWTRALKYVLRQDPDVVLVGEMRDYETIASAITVSETGHLVFATLHTNSAAQTIDRIIDVFPAHQQSQIRSQLANVLVTVISQRLIPLARGGRKAAVEILIGTSAVKNAIRENKTYQIDNIIQTSAEVGMIPLEKSLADMVKSGDITLDTALEYTSKPDQLKDLLR